MMAVSLFGIFAVLVAIALLFGCFVLAGFVARKFATTTSGILIGGLAGVAAYIVLNIVIGLGFAAIYASTSGAY
ncbi:MAG: hypothetical protein ACPGRD_11025 [Planktomarina sp.]